MAMSTKFIIVIVLKLFVLINVVVIHEWRQIWVGHAL